MSKAWSDDEIITLARMSHDGWTLGGIAKKLKRSRGSVIGKAWRLRRMVAK